MRRVVLYGTAQLLMLLMAACNLTGVQPAVPTTAPVTTQPPTPTVAISDTPRITATTALSPMAPSSMTPVPTAPPASPPPLSAANAPAVIIVPIDGSIVSGTPLDLRGVVNNLPNDRFTLELRDASGNTITTQEITLRNPNQVAQVSWSASLFTRYTGEATIYLRARDLQGREFVAASVRITIAAQDGASDVHTTSSTVAVLIVPWSSTLVMADGKPLDRKSSHYGASGS